MISKIRAFFLLAVIGCTAVHAEPDRTSMHDEHERNVSNMTVALKEYLYEIQQETSKIKFRVDSSIGEVWVSFQDFNGRIVMLDKGLNINPAIVDINTKSLNANAGFIGELLQSDSFFDTEKFPFMRFTGSSFEWYNSTHAVLKGYLTIQDVTQPVAFYVELVNADADNKFSERITMKATTTIKRSEFGMDGLLPVVSDDVNLFMSIDAVKSETTISMM